MDILTCVILVVVVGILVPIIMKGVMKIQKKWRKKIFLDNGRMDIIDEIHASRNSTKQKQ